jgi:DNA-binding transcriptional MerR regulator/ubiquinone/menaquinone biosynthesis C-methylase UbiE
MYKITELGRLFGLSRSALLYYDKIGLLVPSARTGSGYRLYTEIDRNRLETVCAYRQAGLTLEEIKTLLDSDTDPDTELLKQRLSALGKQIRNLQSQQRVLAGMLRSVSTGFSPAGVDKETWVAILRAAGMDDADMGRWHREFERRAPDAHHAFLLSLGISEAEAIYIRKLSMNEDAMKYFFDIYNDLPRQGPGKAEYTIRALDHIQNLPEKPLILDIGCGCGAQTLDLARETNGKIVALDNHAPFLRNLDERALAEKLAAKIETRPGSMFDLPFEPATFDLIWSEGAMYIIGVARGLAEWKPLLKPGGTLAFTEACWTAGNPPAEVHGYWMAEYPAMTTVAGNLRLIEAAGYREIGHFVLPHDAWEESYYAPLGKRLAEVKKKYAGVSEAETVFAMIQREMDIFERYKNFFGYAFFIVQKP